MIEIKITGIIMIIIISTLFLLHISKPSYKVLHGK